MPLPFKPEHVKISKADELDLRLRIVSFIHGILCVIFAGYHFYMLHGQCGEPNTLYQRNLACMSIGYFIYDYTAMAYYGVVDLAMTFHHWISIFGLSFAVSYGQFLNFGADCQYFQEISNPFMHFKCILRSYGLRYTKSYEFCEIAFMVLYMYGRIIIGGTTVWSIFSCQHSPMIPKVVIVGMTAQSFWFIFTMVSILKNRLKEQMNRKKCQIKLRWFEPLNKQELEKLGITGKKEKAVSQWL